MLNAVALAEFEQAVFDSRPVAGLTHSFYRYPARFSPAFARGAIEAFTDPGDLVLDPFVGGGTSIVEAVVLGRSAVGADISELATFITNVKTTPLDSQAETALRTWLDSILPTLTIQGLDPSSFDLRATNLDRADTWRIKRLISQALSDTATLPSTAARDFARCLVLKTAQWALDGRRLVPTVESFRQRLATNLDLMLQGLADFSAAATATQDRLGYHPPEHACVVSAAANLDTSPIWSELPAPRLILTSPPYAGVHVLYHRWQVRGRRETAAPFWISDSSDGHGAAHYTFGARTNEERYFAEAQRSFEALARIADQNTRVVQLVGFSDPTRQLPLYLNALASAGFAEQSMGPRGRLWRQVPNRKWHADQKGFTPASKEVILVHRLS